VRFVGLDLAWSPRNRTGGAVLAANGQVLDACFSLESDQEIVDYVARAVPSGTPGLVAIDAPLAVPNETGGRPCDRQAAAVFRPYEAAPYLANRRLLARYGGLRAEKITRELGRQGFRHDPWLVGQIGTRRIVEVFPHPATVSLFDLERTLKYKARKGRDYELRWAELERLRSHLASLAQSEPPLFLPAWLREQPIEGLRGRAFKEIEDLLDALLCAYGALFAWSRGPRGYALYRSLSQFDDPDNGHILVPMTSAMWQRIKKPRILFLDRDGTLNQGMDGRPPNRPNEVRLLPSVGPILHHYASMGWRLVIVTNQGGVAFGYHSESQAQATHRSVLAALPVEVDASYICPHHPRGSVDPYAFDCRNRKPAPGAILDALHRYRCRAADCLFVGDQDTDQQAAVAAQVPFQWAADFFGWEPRWI
jgi:histidinol-phosphate phosphatase family protein